MLANIGEQQDGIENEKSMDGSHCSKDEAPREIRGGGDEVLDVPRPNLSR